MTTRSVPFYGLHTDADGIKWLLQPEGPINAIGLPETACPFTVKVLPAHCSHLYDFHDAKADPELVGHHDIWYEKSELFRLISNIPYKPDVKCAFVETSEPNNYLYLNQMIQMGSPSGFYTLHAMMLKEPGKIDFIMKRLNASNIARFLIFGVKQEHLSIISQLIQALMGSPGRLIIAGEKLPLYSLDKLMSSHKFDRKIITFLQGLEDSSQVKTVGAHVMRRYMRGEHAYRTPSRPD